MGRDLLLLLLLLAAGRSDSFAAHEDDAGLEFVVVFTENVAYYHPMAPANRIQIMALYDDTVVDLWMHTYQHRRENLDAGQTRDILVDDRLELRKKKISDKTLVITSTRKITVHATTLKVNSVQTALVVAADQLGRDYVIPPVPPIPGTTDQVSLNVTERRPFTLFIVSGKQETKVTVEGRSDRVLRLQPQQVAQVLVHTGELRAVTADHPVAVLFGHACAIRHGCTCGLLQTALSPSKQQKVRFLAPPPLADGDTLLLVSNAESTTIKEFSADSPLVETNGTALLYRPGLLLSLIPETDFASCYVINRVHGMQNFAVILVHNTLADGVRMGTVPLKEDVWGQLAGTEFVSTTVELQLNQSVIWHTSHKMAVYFYGRDGSTPFGNPAPVISKTADFRGCVLAAEVVHLGAVAAGWRESVKYCRDRDLQLLSLSHDYNVTHIHKLLVQVNNGSVREAWLGMRRSSQTGEWYWLNTGPVNATNWVEGEPGAVNEGQCAIMSLESDKEFGWSDEDCCRALRPVCHRPVSLFPLG